MSDTEIIADLFVYLMAERANYKDLECMRAACNRLRQAYETGDKMNGLAATYCDPSHPNYAIFGVQRPS